MRYAGHDSSRYNASNVQSSGSLGLFPFLCVVKCSRLTIGSRPQESIMISRALVFVHGM